jgi:hypothetical protein
MGVRIAIPIMVDLVILEWVVQVAMSLGSEQGPF